MVAGSQQNHSAGYVWISGVVIFSVVCVWVLDLPTGNGLCENCGAVEKLWRTFFDIQHGSGLDGRRWSGRHSLDALSMLGYAFGAKLGLCND